MLFTLPALAIFLRETPGRFIAYTIVAAMLFLLVQKDITEDTYKENTNYRSAFAWVTLLCLALSTLVGYARRSARSGARLNRNVRLHVPFSRTFVCLALQDRVNHGADPFSSDRGSSFGSRPAQAITSNWALLDQVADSTLLSHRIHRRAHRCACCNVAPLDRSKQ